MAQRVKDLASSLHQLGLLLWLGFDPWPKKKKRRRASDLSSNSYPDTVTGLSGEKEETTIG